MTIQNTTRGGASVEKFIAAVALENVNQADPTCSEVKRLDPAGASSQPSLLPAPVVIDTYRALTFNFIFKVRTIVSYQLHYFIRSKRILLVWLLLLVVLSLQSIPTVRAADITVTTTADAIDAAGSCAAITIGTLPGAGDGLVSLREAICAANNTAGPDSISFSSPGTHTLALVGTGEDSNATGDLDIRDDLTINGLGTNSTIIQAGTTGPTPGPGNGIDRVLHLATGGITVIINNVTIRHGRLTGFADGAGIYNPSFNSTITINNSLITANETEDEGGGIRYQFGTLNLNNSTVSNNITDQVGGGISAADGATLNIADSTISGNFDGVFGGGGIFLYNTTANIANSTISGNVATDDGGGIRGRRLIRRQSDPCDHNRQHRRCR
ncbi:MAG: hypothetical protein R3F53_15685 [Gammaproteobacteria bacterium]